MISQEIRDHLERKILPFWMALKDGEYGGFYGYMDNNLLLNRKADKGCVLNSRILWTFATAAEVLGREDVRAYADHAYEFFRRFEDAEHGGVYWSVTYDGYPADTTKHTYCQAFAIYGLAAYYRLTGKREVLDKAMDLFRIIETRCKDEGGYLEAMKADFSPETNEKLSENGVMAGRTMNTLLHVVEAYTELHRAYPDVQLMIATVEGLNEFVDKVYNPGKRRLDVFFDEDFRPLLDMQSYGHDIEGSWLIWDSAETFLQPEGRETWKDMCLDLLESVTERAFTDRGLKYESVNGKVNETRTWWPQAETMLGFEFGWRMTGDKIWLARMRKEWDYILKEMVDPREGAEWYNELRKDGTLIYGKPMVDEWKCPYHNGRMCLRLIRAGVPDGI